MTLSRLRTVVSTNWVREQISTQLTQSKASKKLRILDTSFVPNKEIDAHREFYMQGHIPQSLFFDLHKCVKSTPEIPRNIPEVDCFTDYVQSLGVWPDTHVIAYHRFSPLSAYRAWWLFRLYGHRKVSVLDGGLKKWLMDGFEVSQEVPEVDASDFQAKIDTSLIRGYDDILENVRSKKSQLVDARDAEHPTVTEEELDGGRIPGSKHINFDDMFSDDLTIKSEQELKAMFDRAGVDLGLPIISSCLTGMTACGISAAAYILGKDNVPVYNGAWNEWRQRAPEELKEKVKKQTAEE